MATTAKPPVLVVLQLSGGNDYMNTVVPYKDPLYWDYRPRVALPKDQILLLDNDVGLHPSMGPIRDMYNQGRWRSSMGWAIRTRYDPTSARWTSGTPVSRRKRGPRAG